MRKDFSKISGVLLLVLLHLSFISGEYLSHDHHLKEHHSNILDLLNCKFDSTHSIIPSNHNLDDVQGHECCESDYEMLSYLPNGNDVKQKIDKIFYAELQNKRTNRFIEKAAYVLCTTPPNILDQEYNLTSNRAPPLA